RNGTTEGLERQAGCREQPEQRERQMRQLRNCAGDAAFRREDRTTIADREANGEKTERQKEANHRGHSRRPSMEDIPTTFEPKIRPNRTDGCDAIHKRFSFVTLAAPLCSAAYPDRSAAGRREVRKAIVTANAAWR